VQRQCRQQAPHRIAPALATSWLMARAMGRLRPRLEIEMDEVATKIVDILKKHMKEPRDDISLTTALTDLKIESLDLAMIVFDIEDTFGVEIPYNANEDVQDFKTVGSVVEKVKGLMAAGPSAASA
jgi:acyl carrier protein